MGTREGRASNIAKTRFASIFPSQFLETTGQRLVTKIDPTKKRLWNRICGGVAQTRLHLRAGAPAGATQPPTRRGCVRVSCRVQGVIFAVDSNHPSEALYQSGAVTSRLMSCPEAGTTNDVTLGLAL